MADEDKAGDAAAFLRQRRNLILGSIALLFVEVAELRIKPDVTLLGVGFSIEHPEAMVWLLWIAVFYWALRYYQYQQLAPSELRRLARQKILWGISAYFTKNAQQLLAEQYASKPTVAEGETAVFIPSQPDDIKWGLFSGTASLVSFWIVRVGDKNTQQHKQPAAVVKVPVWRLWPIRIRAYTDVVLRTPEFTEHWLPYLLFASPMVIKAYQLIPSA